MCGENEPDIPVYRFNNNGMGGPTEDTINGILDNVRGELENCEGNAECSVSIAAAIRKDED